MDLLRRILNGLIMDVSRRVASGGIAMALNVFITSRLIGYRQRIDDIVARIRAGTYVRRRPSSKPRAPATVPRPPRPPGPVKQSFGWVLPLIPPYWNANGYGAALESLLADPEMVALIQAAPVALGRPLRSLCWMLRLKPPPVLAPPKRSVPRPTTPPAPDPKPPAPAAAAPPPASAPPRPHPPRPHRRAAAPPPAGACGPPLPA
jgi:hypothetical protein